MAPSVSVDKTRNTRAAAKANPAAVPANHFFRLGIEKMLTSNADTRMTDSIANQAERVCESRMETIRPTVARPASHFHVRPALYKTNKTKGISNACAEPKRFRFAIRP